MVDRVPRPPNEDDTAPAAIAEVAELLREAGRERREFGRDLMRPEDGRELARRLTMPPDVLADELLRDGGA